MVLLFATIPGYLVIADIVADAATAAPALALDRALPVQPVWSVVYLSLFLAALLPIFVVHQQDLIGRVVRAFLFAWWSAFAIFLLYPTHATIPLDYHEQGFFPAVLGAIYDSDAQYNCFPSLHVAQCYLAALTCWRVHRGVGAATITWATLVALSTLFTKQHYVVDVIGGGALAGIAYLIFLRSYPREATPEAERRLAPLLALGAFALYGVMVIGFWLIWRWNGS